MGRIGKTLFAVFFARTARVAEAVGKKCKFSKIFMRQAGKMKFIANILC